jgi:hypothetical protein
MRHLPIRPLDIASEPDSDRPVLTGDPMSRTQAELSRDGYGLRPDPAASPALYAAWLEAAKKPGRMLFAKRPDKHVHAVTTQSSPFWIGSVLTGSAPYVSISSTFGWSPLRCHVENGGGMRAGPGKVCGNKFCTLFNPTRCTPPWSKLYQPPGLASVAKRAKNCLPSSPSTSCSPGTCGCRTSPPS